MQRSRAVTCYCCGKAGHVKRDCPESTQATENCYNCDEPGHLKKDCPQAKDAKPQANCNEPGHLKDDCPQVKEAKPQAYLKNDGPHVQAKSQANCREPGDCPTRNTVTCYNCNESGHFKKDCPQPTRNTVVCYNCNKSGHFKKDCPQATRNKPGHLRKDCPGKAIPQVTRNRSEMYNKPGHLKKDCLLATDSCNEPGHSRKDSSQHLPSPLKAKRRSIGGANTEVPTKAPDSLVDGSDRGVLTATKTPASPVDGVCANNVEAGVTTATKAPVSSVDASHEMKTGILMATKIAASPVDGICTSNEIMSAAAKEGFGGGLGMAMVKPEVVAVDCAHQRQDCDSEVAGDSTEPKEERGCRAEMQKGTIDGKYKKSKRMPVEANHRDELWCEVKRKKRRAGRHAQSPFNDSAAPSSASGRVQKEPPPSSDGRRVQKEPPSSRAGGHVPKESLPSSAIGRVHKEPPPSRKEPPSSNDGGGVQKEPPPSSDGGRIQKEPPPISDGGRVQKEPPPSSDGGHVQKEPPPSSDGGRVQREPPPSSDGGHVQKEPPPSSDGGHVPKEPPPSSDGGHVQKEPPPSSDGGHVQKEPPSSSDGGHVPKETPPSSDGGRVPKEHQPSNAGGHGQRQPLPPFVDTHCHLEYVFERYKHQGTFSSFKKTHGYPRNFDACIVSFCDPAAFSSFGIWSELLSEGDVWAAFGIHPHNAQYYNDNLEEKVLQCIEHERCVAFGEIGLDYAHHSPSPPEVQKGVLERQLKLGVTLCKPFVIHCRDAEEDLFRIMSLHVPKEWKIHLHCFTGSLDSARRFLEHFPNLYIGVTGNVTYETSRNVRAIAREVPLERLLVETDAPYNTPRNLPRAGRCKFSHPAHAYYVAKEIATLKKLELDKVLRQIRDNTTATYGI